MIKKLLILLLFLGFSLGQDGRYKHIDDNKRFDTKNGETEIYYRGEWRTHDEISKYNKKNFVPLDMDKLGISFYDYESTCKEQSKGKTKFERLMLESSGRMGPIGTYEVSFSNNSGYDITQVEVEFSNGKTRWYSDEDSIDNDNNKIKITTECNGSYMRIKEVDGRKRSIFPW